jgi:glycosyltransferase involved in cell wall biosynthesis
MGAMNATTEAVIPQIIREGGDTRVLIVQYAGDYLTAYERMQRGQGETYYGNRYFLETATRLGQTFGSAAILCCKTPHPYSTRTTGGLTLIGAGADPKREAHLILEHATRFNPTHLVVLGPLTDLLRWGVDTGRRTIGLLADSFEVGRVQRFMRYGRLASVLNAKGVDWIANHGVNACRSLKRIGVNPEKVIPWDYPYQRKPSDMPPRLCREKGNYTLLYVGALLNSKGVGDAIAALHFLRRSGVPGQLMIAGHGNLEAFKKLAFRLGLTEWVSFLGLIPNDRVFELMRQAAAVLVPSRHPYPEAMPLTIYEALCARTPIISSDHPMFHGHLRDGETALVFPAGKPRALAQKIQELFTNDSLYGKLSLAAPGVWQGLQIETKWADLIDHWVRGGTEDLTWLKERSLASLSAS